MGKISLKHLLLIAYAFVFLAIVPVHAEDNDNDILLKSVQLKKQSDGQLVVNIVSNKKFLTTPLLFEKTKNTYFISLPATKYEGNHDVDISNVKDDVSSVTVDFVPYKSSQNSGYTRIIIVTKETMPIVLKEKLSSVPIGTLLTIIIISGIIILAIAYLAFALYSKVKRKKNVEIYLDEYQYIQDENMQIPAEPHNEISTEERTIANENSISNEETDLSFKDIEAKVETEKEEFLTDIFDNTVQSNNLTDNAESFASEQQEETSSNNVINTDTEADITYYGLEENENDIEATTTQEEIDTNANTQEESLIEENTDQQTNTDIFTAEPDIDSYENSQMVTNEVLEEETTEPFAPTAEEIVSDILGSENTLEEISETIVNNNSEIFDEHNEEDDDEESETITNLDRLEEFNDATLLDANSFTDSDSEQINDLGAYEDVETNNHPEEEEQLELIESDDMLDEILDDIQENIEESPKASPQNFDEIIATDIVEQTDENLADSLVEDSYNDTVSDEETNDYALAEVQHISAGSTISGKTFDFTVLSNQKQNTKEEKEETSTIEDNLSQDEISPFEEYGFEGMTAGDELLPDNSNESTELEVANIDSIDSIDSIDNVDPIDISDIVTNNEEPNEDISFTNSVESHKEVIETNNEQEYASGTNPPLETEIEPSEPTQDNSQSVDNTPVTKEEIIAAHIFKPKPEYLYKYTEQESTENNYPQEENINNFFTDTEEVAIEQEYTNEFFVENIEPEVALGAEETKPQIEEVPDDSEPIVIDKQDFSKNKSIYLLRHNGEYSLVATIGEDVFVIEKFATSPSANKIILKHNEKRANDDVYIAKVGSWRALISVSSNNVKNVLTL